MPELSPDLDQLREICIEAFGFDPKADANATREKISTVLTPRTPLNIERLRSLKSEELFGPTTSPEVALSHLQELGELYTSNDAPDALFLKLKAFHRYIREESKSLFAVDQLHNWDDLQKRSFENVINEAKLQPQWTDAAFQCLLDPGGMLNRWDATPAERLHYPTGYKSPKELMLEEMENRSEVPGRYFVRGLRSPDGTLISSLSYRLFPQEEQEKIRYVSHLKRERFLKEKVCFDTEKMGIATKIFRKHKPLSTMMEIDTINVRKGWKGAGTLQLAETLDHIARTEPLLPLNIFYYRFWGLDISSPFVTNAFKAGKNNLSEKLFTQCGFRDFGTHIPDPVLDIVVRQVDLHDPESIATTWPEWRYGWAPFHHALDRSAACAALLKQDQSVAQ